MKNQQSLPLDKDDAALCSDAWAELKAAQADIFKDDDTLSQASFDKMNGGMTNICFKLTTKRGVYFLRLPGKGSSAHLSRANEEHNLKIAQRLGLNVQIFFFNSETGMYVSEFLDQTIPLSARNLTETQTMKDVANVLKILHTSKDLLKNDIPIFERLKNLITQIESPKLKHECMYDPAELKFRLNILERICKKDASEMVACHNDTTPLNFLYHKRKLKLLDWEYSGNGKALFDLANFAVTAKLSREAEQALLQAYFGISPSKTLWHVFNAYKQATCLWYYLWAELQLANKSDVVPKAELIKVAQKSYNAVMCQEAPLPARRAPRFDGKLTPLRPAHK